jgi:hypothetical protein
MSRTVIGEGLQNLGLCSALKVFEQRGIFILPIDIFTYEQIQCGSKCFGRYPLTDQKKKGGVGSYPPLLSSEYFAKN